MSEQRDRAASQAPAVSILIVARNTGSLIGDAILSARRQTFADIEIVVVDNLSTDDTLAVAQDHAARDPRVRVLTASRGGLAEVRNVSLAAARGRWAAILDSDDLLHPAHIERLVAAATRTGAELVAANIINFRIDAGITRSSLFADGAQWREEQYFDLPEYVRANGTVADGVVTGYLKPLFCVGFLRRHALSYDPRLRIAEDYDLVARALAAGARYLFLPRPTYFYRRHANSTSHRLSAADLTGMLATSESLAIGGDRVLHEAVARRRRGIRSALAHSRAIGALKGGRALAAVRALGGDADAWRALARSVIEGGRRRLRGHGTAMLQAAAPVTPSEPVVLAVGGDTQSGSGAALAAAIAHEGRAVLHRAAPHDDATRAALADGLPPIARILIAAPATLDDAAYAMAVSVQPEVIVDPSR